MTLEQRVRNKMKTIEEIITDRMCIACSRWEQVKTTSIGVCKSDGWVHRHLDEEKNCRFFDCALIGTITKRLADLRAENID